MKQQVYQRFRRMGGWLAWVLLAGLLLSGCATKHKGSNLTGQVEPFVDPKRPPTAQSRLALARILADQGRVAEAEVAYSNLARDLPTYAPAYNKLAEIMIRQRRFDAAVKVLKAGLDHLPGDPVLLNNLGMCHLLLQDYPQAADWFAKAAATRPLDSLYQANLALATGMQGRFDDAMRLYKQIMPEEQAYRNICVIYTALGDNPPPPPAGPGAGSAATATAPPGAQ